MLSITIPGTESYDERKNEFVQTEDITLKLEHSLVSISKWESYWNKPFLSSKDKSNMEILDYIRCMTVTQNVKLEVYLRLTNENMRDINSYIDAPMTATTFKKSESSSNKDIVTSEIIYYWMIVQNIPLECQKWHLNRLLTLINVCSIKNQPKKKMSKGDIIKRNRDLNKQRKEALKTKG